MKRFGNAYILMTWRSHLYLMIAIYKAGGPHLYLMIAIYKVGGPHLYLMIPIYKAGGAHGDSK
jgi:hypothetical protein